MSLVLRIRPAVEHVPAPVVGIADQREGNLLALRSKRVDLRLRGEPRLVERKKVGILVEAALDLGRDLAFKIGQRLLGGLQIVDVVVQCLA